MSQGHPFCVFQVSILTERQVGFWPEMHVKLGEIQALAVGFSENCIAIRGKSGEGAPSAAVDSWGKGVYASYTLSRLVDAIKYEVKRYLKRERRRQLPEDAGCWGFDCRFGVDEASAEIIHVSEIKKISWAESEGLESFYLEALVKSCRRTKMPLQE